MTLDIQTLPPVIERDSPWERPLILQPDGTRIPYTRTSTFAKCVDDSYGLMTHKMREVAIGVGRREDLAAMAAACTIEDTKELDYIIKYAIDFAGGMAAANHGTAIHKFTEPNAQPFAPKRMEPDIRAWNEGLERENLRIVATEQFVVNDLYRVAGTFDHILEHPLYGCVMCDKKTGKRRFPFVAVQLATYAKSQHAPNASNSLDRFELDINPDVGLVAWIPKGEARVVFEEIDLRKGWLTAKTAAELREAQKTDYTYRPSDYDTATQHLQRGGLIEDAIIAQIHAARKPEELDELWYKRDPLAWTDRHTAAAAAHKRQLLTA